MGAIGPSESLTPAWAVALGPLNVKLVAEVGAFSQRMPEGAWVLGLDVHTPPAIDADETVSTRIQHLAVDITDPDASRRWTISCLDISSEKIATGSCSSAVTYCAMESDSDELCTTMSSATKLWSPGTVRS